MDGRRLWTESELPWERVAPFLDGLDSRPGGWKCDLEWYVAPAPLFLEEKVTKETTASGREDSGCSGAANAEQRAWRSALKIVAPNADFGWAT